MNATEQQAFNDANKTVHLVETQWHYEKLIPAGYVALTPSQVGFVRTYHYEHPTTGSKIVATTGSSADYWEDTVFKARGYWASLEPHVKALAEKSVDICTN